MGVPNVISLNLETSYIDHHFISFFYVGRRVRFRVSVFGTKFQHLKIAVELW